MSDTSEAETAKADLLRELDDHIRHCRSGGVWNYRTATLLTCLTVVASGSAALITTFGNQRLLTACIALIPGICSSLTSIVRFEHKSRWFWTKCREVEGLRSRILYEDATATAISRQYRRLLTQSERDWPAFGTGDSAGAAGDGTPNSALSDAAA